MKLLPARGCPQPQHSLRIQQLVGVPGPVPKRRGLRGVAAFTLIELIISSALMALILASGYMCLSSALSSRRMIESRADVAQNARVTLALIAADLRSACLLSKEFQFMGMDRMLGEVEADNLDFGTRNYTPRRTGEADFCEVSYFVAPEPESGQFSLWRRRDPTPDDEPLAGGGREEIARGVRGVRFEYYDGWEWFDEWGDPEGKGKAQNSLLEQSNLTGLPDAVRVTLWLDSNEKRTSDGDGEEISLVFQTVAHLNLARAARSSASASESGESGAANNPTQPQNAPPGGGPQ